MEVWAEALEGQSRYFLWPLCLVWPLCLGPYSLFAVATHFDRFFFGCFLHCFSAFASFWARVKGLV